MDIRFINSIHHVDPTLWNQLCTQDYPFTRYEFLAALEDTGCTSVTSGWEIAHLVIYENDCLIAAMPGYVKKHSYGEYVFDWAWADAYRRYGLQYYPKWINAIPFTPCTGPRLLTGATEISTELIIEICQALKNQCELHKYSGWHCLFPTNTLSDLLTSFTMQRLGCQFHWFNRNYQNFNDFLAQMSSRKRKNIAKERRSVSEQGIGFAIKESSAISVTDMDLFYSLYRNTYLKRSGHAGYLTQAFFQQLLKTCGDSLVLVCAVEKSDDFTNVIAAALFFRDSHTLYGRYWGCFEEYQFLHFETCYYQGIDYAIKHKLQRFDGGAQGEHKISRGFEPVITYSNHHLSSSDFHSPIARFLQEEREAIQQYAEDARELLPFKNSIYLD